MAERLIVENFGPIKKIDIELNRILILIGPQSVGKSTIAKLVAIFRSDAFIFENDEFEASLKKYGINTYLKKNTSIHYKSKSYSYDFKKGLGEKILNKESSLYKFFSQTGELYPNNFSDSTKKINMLQYKILDEIEEYNTILEKLKKAVNDQKDIEVPEYELVKEKHSNLKSNIKTGKILIKEIESFTTYSEYIPAERILIPIISNSVMNLINYDIPIPKIFIEFASQFEKARQDIKEYNINFLFVTFKYVNNENRLYTSKKAYFLLENASSGLQSIIPLLLVIKHKISKTNYSNTFIIEEPELNLYPKNQYELSKILASVCFNEDKETERHNELIITTHSPYVLAAFNNLLLAHKVGDEVKLKVSKVIPQQSWIDPEHFSAYYIDEKGIVNIFNKESGLIAENHLDQTSEIIMDDFNDLMDLYTTKAQG